MCVYGQSIDTKTMTVCRVGKWEDWGSGQYLLDRLVKRGERSHTITDPLASLAGHGLLLATRIEHEARGWMSAREDRCNAVLSDGCL